LEKITDLKSLDTYISGLLDNSTFAAVQPNGPFMQHYHEIKTTQLCNARNMPEYDNLNRFFETIERKIRRRREELKEMQGTVKVPKIITKTERTTKDYLLSLDDIDASYELADGSYGKENLLTIAKDFENTLQSWESGFILDTIYQYTEKYFSHGPFVRDSVMANPISPEIKMQESFNIDASGEFFVLITSLDDFFNTGKAKGNISQEDRRKIKQALFPTDKTKKGLLEEVTFYTSGDDGKPFFLTQKFIFANKVGGRVETIPGKLKGISGDLQTVTTNTPSWFELRINADLFEYLKSSEKLKAGKGSGFVGMGYMRLPSFLQIKIEKSLNRVEAFTDGTMVGNTIKKNRAAYRWTTIHVLHKWQTGQEVRMGPMYVSYGELCDLGFFPKNTKDKSRRTAILHALQRIIADIAYTEEGLPGAKSVTVKGSQVVIDQAIPQITP